jgi:hypothetical protein
MTGHSMNVRLLKNGKIKYRECIPYRNALRTIVNTTVIKVWTFKKKTATAQLLRQVIKIYIKYKRKHANNTNVQTIM